METKKKYWCFSCNKQCQIIKSIEDGDEVYQCSFCKNSFVEEMEEKDNNQAQSSEQTQTQAQAQSQTQPQPRSRIIINLNNINNSNSTNIRNTRNISGTQNNIRNNQNGQNEYQYGMNDTLLFLPSTVNYVQLNSGNIFPSLMNSIGTFINNISPTFNNILMSLNLDNPNNGLLSFLNNHNNDSQFNNLVNILMSFDLGSNRHPPASERAINNLKKVEVSELNINDYKNITCNICLENFEVGNVLLILECSHEFHEKCIITWLKTNNTCPICRHELESNDPNYERRKNNHRENLRNLHRNNNLNNGNNNNNNSGGNSGMFV